MPETVVVTPTPTTHHNAPQAKAEAPPEAPKPPADATPQEKLDYEKLYANKKREHVLERRKWEAEKAQRDAKLKEYEPKLTRLQELEKREAQAKANPAGFLKSIYGDGWKDVLSEAAVHGVTPAALVAEKLEEIEAKNEARWRAKEAEEAKAREQAKSAQVDQARQSLFAEGAAFVRASAKDFPALADLGQPPVVARMLAQEVERAYFESLKPDADGNVGEPRHMTMKEAAEIIENRVLDLASKATKHEKYKSKLQPAPTSSTVASPSKSISSQQASEQQKKPRQQLTNDITGSTVTPRPAISDDDRRQRAFAAYDAAKRKA